MLSESCMMEFGSGTIQRNPYIYIYIYICKTFREHQQSGLVTLEFGSEASQRNPYSMYIWEKFSITNVSGPNLEKIFLIFTKRRK